MKVNTVNKSKFRGLFGFSKYTVTLILIYFLLATGVTYAYFAFQYQNDSVIVGNIISLDADLEVELIVGANNEFVPMSNEALSNAINGVGSENGACVDQKGNLSCQVYKITFTNNGSRLKHITGTIELYAKDGTGNVYNNLKWRELTNATTVKESAIINGMDKSILVSDLTVESKEVKEWYIAVWLSETNSDQLGTDKGDFGGTVTFESGSGGSATTNIFTETILKPSAQPDTNIDFSETSEASNTNGVYLMSSTANDTNPIYYYRGNVNNNLIFAETCWKVVRTTNTGGLKLLYNGTPSNGQCNGTNSSLGYKEFNVNYNSPAYVGYMYSSPYTYSSKSMSSVTDTYYYGNDVTYSNGTYTLTNTISSNSWSSIYNSGLNNNHYTCLSTGTTCSSVYYIYYTDSSTAYYITLTGGKKVEDALTAMLGADDANTTNYNTTSSTIKGNNTTTGTLDYWYYTNIEQKGYSSYIEDTVWCNDRSISSLNGWNPDGGSTTAYLYFSSYNRVWTNASPSLSCTRNIDSFTVSEANGNGDLDYPVGLLTADEIMLAGADNQYTENYSYYLYNEDYYWAGSPVDFNYSKAYESGVNDNGNLNRNGVYNTSVVRPSVSLKPGFSLTGNGDGTATNPYKVG